MTGKTTLVAAAWAAFSMSVVLAGAGDAAASDAAREMEFCGGGDEGESDGSIWLYEIEEQIQSGELREARRRLATGIRRGRFRGQVRGLALAAWAETELRLGSYRRAAGLYRRAIRAQGVDADDPLHVGLAVALVRSRRGAQGRVLAQRFAEAACPDGASDDPVACYGARLVLATTAPSPAEQADAMRVAEAVRTGEPRLEESFAQMRGLFPATEVASIGDRSEPVATTVAQVAPSADTAPPATPTTAAVARVAPSTDAAPPATPTTTTITQVARTAAPTSAATAAQQPAGAEGSGGARSSRTRARVVAAR